MEGQERQRRSFVVRVMASPYTLPALGASILAAVALGIHLGQSSIGLINPIYYQGPAIHPRDRGAAIDERQLAARAPAYGELYGWGEGAAARSADCQNCEALRARNAHAYSAEVPYFGGRAAAPAPAVREAAAPVAVQVSYGDELPPAEEVVEPKGPALRYAYYPIVEEPVEAADVAAEAEPEPSKE
ncbi:MAG TPA: hypothetical protein VGX37_01145 [Allosphingosinicella sp.]|nr:hypothetical protein [Allosphingosinicella sp.]